MSALIRATDLSVSHAGADLPVLRHVDFHISPAEIVTVVGPNGSGKSTLVRALLGHVPTDTGRVERLPSYYGPGHDAWLLRLEMTPRSTPESPE